MSSVADIKVMTIDQGNSSAKAVVWHAGAPVASVRLFELSIEGLLPLLEEHEIDGCVYCNVGHPDAKFLETLRRLVDGSLVVLTHSTPLPISVEYASRSTLGNDRVAAAAGAASLFPGEGVLVVDAGTAVTVDILDPSPAFRGGNIAPGMALRFNSLHDYTSRLPLVDPDGPVPDFGYDTVTAIRSGVVGGMVSEIADAFVKAREEFNCSRIALTGNDADVLFPLLKGRRLPVSRHQNLVGLGLLSIYLFNEISN